MVGSYKILMNAEGCTYYNGILKEKNMKKEKVKLLDLKSLRKNSKLDIVVEGKELFIEDITLQRVRGEKIYQLVECALVERFHSLNQIAFDYRVYKREKDKIKVIIYCLNLGNLQLKDEDDFKYIRIKSVKVIQQLYADYFIKAIKKNEFYGLVSNGDYIYFFHVSKNIITQNRVIELNSLHDDAEILKLCSEINDKSERVYVFEKIHNEVLNKFLSKYENLKICEVKSKSTGKNLFNNRCKVVEVQ